MNHQAKSQFSIESLLTDSKKKRSRTIFSSEQLKSLELQFKKQQYIVGEERKVLAKCLKLTETQIKVWFQNRRIKWRKQNHSFQQSHLISISTNDAIHQVDWTT